MVWYEVKVMDGNKKKKKDNMRKEKDINIKKIDGTNDKKKKVKNKDVYLEEGIVSEDISLNKTKGSKRSTFNLVEVIIIMFITTLFGLLLGGFIAYVKLDERDVSCSAIRKDMVEFAGVYDDLLNEYYGEIDKEELMFSAIKGMISYLEDPYSSYIDSMDAELLDEELSGSFVGIGVEIVSVDDQLPVVIHSRDATMDTIEILSNYKVKGVIHSFSGSLETAKKYISMGFLLGINGVVTFKNCKLKEILPFIPLESIILETDSPYLTPTPYRGQKNEPCHIKEIATFLAHIYNVDVAQIAEITSKNVKRVLLNIS